MKRILLAALLLTACQKADPRGTIQPDSAGRTGPVPLQNGDSPPFRLSGGDTRLTTFPAGGAPPLERLAECEPVFALVPYGGSGARSFNTAGTAVSVTRLNGVKPGVYYVRTAAAQAYCRYVLFASPAP